MKRLALPALSVVLLPLSVALLPAPASSQGVAVAAHAGTLGVGGSAVVGLSRNVNLRGTIGLVPLDPQITADQIDFTIDFPVFLLATVDYYPLGFFHLSGGGLFVTDGGAIDVVGEFTGTQTFGSTVYSAADVGDLTGSFGLKTFMPYLGIGFGNPVGGRVGFGLELGVGFGDVPSVGLGATGPIASDPTFIGDLEAREAEIQADIPDVLRYYPVASLALSIRVSG